MVDVLASEGQVSVHSNEYTLVNDNLYALVNASHTPEWLLALIDNEVAKSIARGFKDYDLLVQSVINAISSLDEAEASYVTLTGFDTLVNGIVASRLEALTAQYDEVYATKTEVTNLIATSEQSSAQSISELTANLNDLTDAKITNVQTAIANASSALAEDITTLAVSIGDNSSQIESVRNTFVTDTSALAEEVTTLSTTLGENEAKVVELAQSIDGIEASWGVETDVNGKVAGIKLINSQDSPSKFTISTDIFEVIDAHTGDILIGTFEDEVIVDATKLNGKPATQVLSDLDSLVVDFNTQNNRDGSAVNTPSSVILDHTAMDNGSVDLTVSWVWSGSEASIDGFAINMYASSESGTYLWDSSRSSETIFQVSANKRSNTFSGLPSNLYYSFQVVAYRKVDADINSGGTIVSNWVSPSSSQNPYQPESSMVITADVAGTVGGTSVSTLLNNLDGLATDFNAQNNRDSSSIIDPIVLANGTAIDHTMNSDGSSDISFEWGWSGTEADIDGFSVWHYQSTSSSPHTFGTSPKLEISYIVPASARSFILRGVAANRYHSFGITAYRKVDKDIQAGGIIASNTITSSRYSENPYRPSPDISFSGNITGTIDGYSSDDVVDNAYSGATFTSSTAGDLAYVDKVTTTYIDDLAVNRLKIAGESAGILRYVESNSPIFPTPGSNPRNVNDQKKILGLSITTPEPAKVLLNVSFQQAYDLSVGAAYTSFSLGEGSSKFFTRGLSAVNDTPSVTTCVDIPSGTTTFYLWWAGGDDVSVINRTITGYVSLR